ncbi:MAG: hypothetical protein AAB557_00440 [Patescibacteria group bacterium]
MALNLFYGLVLIVFTIISWGFVDANSSLPHIVSLQPIIYFKTLYPTAWYTASVVALFGWYVWILHSIKKGLLTSKHVWLAIVATVVILMWSYPALSNDIFNYIATAKVTFFYRENPYIIMPIDLSGEPSFSFLHAANKVALYGPVWIVLTGIPHFMGFGNLLLTLFTFKIFIVFWYLVLCYLIWIASQKKPWALAFFALNPLVVLSTLVDGHNDVVMMTLALASFLCIKRRKFVMGIVLLIGSIFIKGATLFLVPVLLWFLYSVWNKRPLPPSRVWYWASIAMYMIFFLSPFREEMYAWYFIWPLTFLALVDKPTVLYAASYGFSLGLSLRIVPFFYTRSWGGMTPLIKKIVTFVPALVSTLMYGKTRLH